MIITFAIASFTIQDTQLVYASQNTPEEHQKWGENAIIASTTPLHEEYSTSTIKNLVIEEFGTSSPMVKVAECESSFRQYNASDTVLTGIVDSDDKGIYQINTQYQLATATSLGYDIYDPFGNIEYAKFLYQTQGLSPWSASKGCWLKSSIVGS